MANYNIESIEYPSVTTVLKLLDKSGALIPWALNQCEEKFNYLISNHNTFLGLEIEGSICKEDVEQYFKEAKYAHRETSQEALSVGSEVHGISEIHIKNKIANTKIELTIEQMWNTYVQKLEPHLRPATIRDQVMQGYFAFLDWEKEYIKTWIDSEKTVHSLAYGYAGTLDAKALFLDGKVRYIDFKTSKKIYDESFMQLAAYRLADYEMTKDWSDGMGILRLDKETGIPEWIECTDKYERSIDSFLALLKFYYLQKNRRLKNNPFVKHIKDLYGN